MSETLRNSSASAALLHDATHVEPLVVPPRAAERMLQCGHTRLYELLDAGELKSFTDGRARRITVASIHDYIERKLNAARAA
jgi:excisionase family DNA binding protein